MASLSFWLVSRAKDKRASNDSAAGGCVMSDSSNGRAKENAERHRISPIREPHAA
ncbi:Hypothetical protein A7982_09332 [Minicystis rosea]|nr:Hypothetical protein A7982_09332 [Minicystis rosea]